MLINILFTIGGAILGFFLNTLFESHKKNKKSANIRKLLLGELNDNIGRLQEVLKLLEYMSEIPPESIIERFSMQEIAEQVEKSCHRTAFEACYSEIPLLGTKSMHAIFDFYNIAISVPDNFRLSERFHGNIRAGLFEDNIQFIIDKSKLAINAITNK